MAEKFDASKLVQVKPRLNEIMNKLGVNGVTLAKEAGIPQPYISRFDKSEQYKIHHLFLISRALNKQIEDLFEVEFLDGEKKADGN